jgi:hypothetical protein
MKVTIKIQVGYRLIKIVQSSEQNDSSSFAFGQNYFIVPVNNYQNTVHTNTTHELDKFGFYFPLLISAMHTDHHKVEYSYKRKVLQKSLSFCTCILPYDGQYVWPKHVVENTR